MNLPRFGALRLVLTAVILCQLRCESDRFAQRHRMNEPMRLAAPGARKGVCSGTKRGAQKIALVIPIPEITAEKECKNHFNVVQREIIGTSNTRAGVITPATVSIAPQIALASDR